MEYQIKLLPVHHQIIGPSGVIGPMCDSCVTPDCSHPVREQLVSIGGQMRKSRLYILNNIVRQVVECAGYMSPESVSITQDDNDE